MKETETEKRAPVERRRFIREFLAVAGELTLGRINSSATGPKIITEVLYSTAVTTTILSYAGDHRAILRGALTGVGAVTTVEMVNLTH